MQTITKHRALKIIREATMQRIESNNSQSKIK